MSQRSLFDDAPATARAVANVDGGSRGNPDPPATARASCSTTGPIVDLKETIGIATNNVAEYNGLLAALGGRRTTATTTCTAGPTRSCLG